MTDQPDVVVGADRVVLPGVGAFAACMSGLRERPGLLLALEEAVRKRGAPFLGVCVGMQLMADRGLEFGETAGLGWIAGEVRPLQPSDPALRVPHMGWNTVEPQRPHPLFAGAEDQAMYFANSFSFHAAEPERVLAVSDHGGAFTAAVAKDNMAGVQFHPEKSQDAGIGLLARFLGWTP